MTCFWCQVAWEYRDSDEVPGVATFIYAGTSTCAKHLNTTRGLPEDFTRYPVSEEVA